MKYKGLSIVWSALAFLFSLSASAEDAITATVCPTEIAGEWTLEINLENPEETRYTAFQFTLNLPQGFYIAEHSAATSTRLPDHSIVMGRTSDSSYVIAAYSLTNAAIVGNSGCVASLTMRADEATQSGEYAASLSNIVISTRAGAETDLYDYTFAWDYEATAPTYTITYWLDGEVYAVMEHKAGETPTPPTAPEKEGHTFTGWENLPQTMPEENLDVEALFAVNKYLLTFQIDGEIIQQDSIAYGAPIAAPDAAEKEGHTFAGWSEHPEFMPAEDVTVSGTYTVNTYKLTYVLNGEVYAEDSVAYGAAIIPLVIEEDETFTFSGWSNLPETMPAHDVVAEGTTTLTAIDAITAQGDSMDIFSLSGTLIARKANAAWVKTRLKGGIYIINGRKVRIE